MPSSTATAVADALQRAQQAVNGLGDDDASFWPKMHGSARQQLQLSDHGKTPALPDRYHNLNKLKSGNPRRPARAAVYDAMDALIAAAWPPPPPMSNTQHGALPEEAAARFCGGRGSRAAGAAAECAAA